MLIYRFSLQRISPPLNAYSQLEEMLAYRACGWSMAMLAERYQVPRDTIRYLCRKFGLNDTVEVTVMYRHAPPKKEKYDYSEEKINKGKTYAEYLKIEAERKKRAAL